MNIEITNLPDGVSLKAKRGEKQIVEFYSTGSTDMSPSERTTCRRMVINATFEKFFPGRTLELVEYSAQMRDPSILPTEERMLKELEELA